ncbi:hypothetical protein Tco_0576284 [Tanacetum coccineum]
MNGIIDIEDVYIYSNLRTPFIAQGALYKIRPKPSGKSSTVAKLLSSVNISNGKIYTNSGKGTLAVGMNMTNSGNALEHFIPNNVLILVPLWSLVKCRHRYAISSLMDTAYRMSEQ